MISLGQKNTLVEYMILSGADNPHPCGQIPVVVKDYERSFQLLRRYLFNKEGKRMFDVPVFSPGDDLIACLIKAMAFLMVVASSRFLLPIINSELPLIQETKPLFKMAGYRTTSSGKHGKIRHMARQCTQSKRPRNASWYKEKAMLAEAQEAEQILDEEQLAFLADPGIPASQAQTIIPHNAAFSD
ncbi:hypothetical protein Tco_0597402 [Tanacetum coccineum]